jgi:glycosyltransferase involved in cell wall biosynthesis
MKPISKKKRVLFIGSYLGKERGTISVAEKLAAKYQNDDTFQIILVSKKQQKLLRVFEIIYHVLFCKYSETFIDTYSGNSFFIARIAGTILRFRGRTYSLIIRGGNFVNYFKRNESWIQRDLLNANSLISPSLYIINFFNRKGIHIDYLPNYIDQSKFPHNPNKLRNPFSLLWVRAFSEIYNPLIPIRIINELKDQFPQVKLTMVGPDLGLLSQAKEEILNLNLGEYIEIVGPVHNDELHTYYQSHNVYLNTTSFESFGMALLEAASCGIPIVSTKVGEIPYIYENGESILLVDDFSIADFVSKIESIFTNEELGMKLSKNGVCVSNNYTFEKIKPIWESQFVKFKETYALNSKKNKVLFIGTFLSRKKGTKGPSEVVSGKLNSLGYKTRISSSYENKLLRIFDIVFSIVFSSYKIVHIDVFSGPNFSLVKYSVFLANLLRKKVVLNLHGGMLPEFYAQNEKTCWNVFNQALQIFTPSKYLQSYFTQLGYNIEYLPNSIDINKFPFELTKKSYKILWVRAFTNIYQPDLAVDILELVKKEFPLATLTMIGPDLGQRAAIEKYIEVKGLSSSVDILGPVDNNMLVNYFHQHSVFINTTLYESFGVAVLEAASSGLPVVSTNVGEISFLWKNQEDILIDNTNSSLGMANLVNLLFRDEEKCIQLALNAKNKSEFFSWQKVEHLWINNIDKLK